MKAVILAGGKGTRLSEETQVKPKPMLEIGGRPLLWHIMKIYSAHQINDFIICLGYKGYLIKEYFANYFLHMSDVTIDLRNNDMEVHSNQSEPWRITLVDTGEETMTGGRIKRVAPYLGEEDVCLTYGDGVADVNLTKLLKFHAQQHSRVTLTAVQPPGRFGALDLKGPDVYRFQEKPTGDGGWVNGGFFVISPQVVNEISGDETYWEREPLQNLASAGELAAYRHSGFWHPMDTLRDKLHLEALWDSGQAPWKVW